MEREPLTLAQKVLLFALYGFLALMIIFSVMSLRNLGQEGYQRCITERCSIVGEEQCQKLREVNNCCLGAGGKVGVQGNKYGCGFED